MHEHIAPCHGGIKTVGIQQIRLEQFQGPGGDIGDGMQVIDTGGLVGVSHRGMNRVARFQQVANDPARDIPGRAGDHDSRH